MRFARVVPALSALAAATVALLALTGAGVAATAPGGSSPMAKAPNLSSPAAINAYLRSIGVKPGSVVVQRGGRNYAGPNCPGMAWRCTMATHVVQIGRFSENVADCASPCVIVQAGDNNSAHCFQRGRGEAEIQSCTITQTGARNHARVHQDVHQNDGSAQDALQTASITQTGTERNVAEIKQEIHQVSNDGTAQTQEAHQSATVEQDATGGADNSSSVDQSQHQIAHGGTTQSQNATFSADADCASDFPFAPNQCVNVDQSSDAGTNASKLKQSTHQNANTQADASQQQGSFSGGLEGKVHQETLTGSSSNDAKQDKRQRLSAAPGSTQTQWDPLSCCGFLSQLGGTDNEENIDQSASQDGSEANAFQEIMLTGQSRSPTGACTISQNAKNNSDTGDNSASLDPCPFLQLVTTCFSGEQSGGDLTGSDSVVIQQEGEGCTEFEPVTTPPCESEFCPDSVLTLLGVRPSG